MQEVLSLFVTIISSSDKKCSSFKTDANIVILWKQKCHLIKKKCGERISQMELPSKAGKKKKKKKKNREK